MSVFAISDLHLPGGERINKSMERFGACWQDHTVKLERSWRALVGEDDTVIIPGDISWAMREDDVRSDLLWIERLPGKKIIGRGNHDFWWTTISKLEKLKREAGIASIEFLQNNAYAADGLVVCGTRGWYSDAASQADIYDGADFGKISAREAARLELSIAAALKLSGGDAGVLRVFLHFPTVLGDDDCPEILSVLEKHKLRRVYFGHVHCVRNMPRSFLYHDIEFICVSADHLGFTPMLVD